MSEPGNQAANPASPKTPPTKKGRRRRVWAFVLVALILGMVVALLLAELLVRVFWTLPPHFAEFGQAGMYVAAADGTPALIPGYRGELRFGNGEPTSVSINRLGMRGDEIPSRQVAGGKRVLVVGDSLVFGYGVEGSEALPACLSRGLSANGIANVVGNGGVPGFGSTHSVARMALLDAQFGADVLVVCGFLGNDAVDDAMPERCVDAGIVHGYPMSQLVQTSVRTRLAMRSRLALLCESWIFTNKPEWSPLAAPPPMSPELAARALGLPPPGKRAFGLFLDARDERTSWLPSKQQAAGVEPMLPRLLGYLRESLVRARELAGERPIVFVVLPSSWQINESKRNATLKNFGFDPLDYPMGLAQKRWMGVARELGIPAFDATPILRAAGPTKDLFILDGGHFNVRGNEVVGQWLAGVLAKLLD